MASDCVLRNSCCFYPQCEDHLLLFLLEFFPEFHCLLTWHFHQWGLQLIMFHPNLHPDLHLQAVSSRLSNLHLHTMSSDPLLHPSIYLHCVSLFNALLLTSPNNCVSPQCVTYALAYAQARRGVCITSSDWYQLDLSVLEMLTRMWHGIQPEFIFERGSEQWCIVSLPVPLFKGWLCCHVTSLCHHISLLKFFTVIKNCHRDEAI